MSGVVNMIVAAGSTALPWYLADFRRGTYAYKGVPKALTEIVTLNGGASVTPQGLLCDVAGEYATTSPEIPPGDHAIIFEFEDPPDPGGARYPGLFRIDATQTYRSYQSTSGNDWSLECPTGVTGVYPLIADGTPNTLVFAKRTGAAGTLVSTNGGPVQVSSAAYGLSGTGIWYLGTIGGGIDLGNFLGTAIRRVEIREGTFSDAQLQSISAGN